MTGGAPTSGADAVLRALAEPQRARIVRLVGTGERSAGDIAGEFAITAQAVSQHLRVLREAHVLRERRVGTRRLYSVRPEAIESVHAFLDDLWPRALDRLKAAVEHDQRATTAATAPARRRSS